MNKVFAFVRNVERLVIFPIVLSCTTCIPILVSMSSLVSHRLRVPEGDSDQQAELNHRVYQYSLCHVPSRINGGTTPVMTNNSACLLFIVMYDTSPHPPSYLQIDAFLVHASGIFQAGRRTLRGRGAAFGLLWQRRSIPRRCSDQECDMNISLA